MKINLSVAFVFLSLLAPTLNADNIELMVVSHTHDRLFKIGTDGNSGFVGQTFDWNYTNSLAINSSGQVYSFADTRNFPDQLLELNPGSGQFEVAQDFNGSALGIRGLTFDRSDHLFAIKNIERKDENGLLGDELISLNVDDGTVSLIGKLFGYRGIQALAFDPEDNLYGYDLFEGLLQIDPLTGSVVKVGFEMMGFQGMDFGPDGTLYGITIEGELYSLDLTTGDAVFLHNYNDLVPGRTTLDARGLVFVTAVPLPAAAWLFISALAGLSWFNRRKLR